MSCCECREREDAARGSILYSILNRGAQCPRGHLETVTAQQLCSCACKRKLVLIRAPRLVFKATSEVLVKTFRFVKNVPCFRGLPPEDQLRLVRNSWAPLLVLGMVQDSVDFDTVETQQPSLLHRILTHSKERQQRTPAETRDPGVPVGDAEGIKMFLVRCRGLSISVREYAFLKGAILFTPGNHMGQLQSVILIVEHILIHYRSFCSFTVILYTMTFHCYSAILISCDLTSP